MKPSVNRRRFIKMLGMSAGAGALGTQLSARTRKRHIQVGHTGITWSNGEVELAITSVGSLGFYGFETFGEVLTKWDAQGGLEPVLEQHHLPLISGYCTLNLVDPAKRKDEIDKAIAWSKLIRKCNGRVFVMGPNQVKRDQYDFAANKANIVAALNEAAKAITDQGLTPVLHQHTGTCVESRDETYAVLDAVDTRYVKFGPDIGQLTKGGANAVQVVKDFLPLVQHMHLKDYNGKDPHLLGYCPLGQGEVNIPAILDLMEGRKIHGMVMGELDNDPKNPSPIPPVELVTSSKKYLQTLGVVFRT
ncbi:MAG TPA: TIM barrel protein [Acidobacteriaceae bacterium]|nr:TIM barrel protein [Acidobacteriaceae bacterium]